MLRGIASTAVTWAIVWVPFSLIPFGIGALLGSTLTSRELVALVIGSAITGALSGAVFAGILAVAGRHKSFETLSLRWIALCGAAGATLLPFALRAVFVATHALPASALLSTIVVNGLLGAGLAAGTLALARRAPVLPSSEPASRAVGAGAA